MIARFFRDIRRYGGYAGYSAVTVLRSEVAYSYLNWLWWVLDPLLLMLVYTFISKYVFTSRPDDFPLFVMLGISLWTFFNKSLLSSVTLISSNRGLLNKTYIPKFILVIVREEVAFIKMLFSFLIVFVLVIAYKLPFTLCYFHLIPVLIMLQIVTFGMSCIFMHIGAFIPDLTNVITVVLRVIMYLSGIFYSIEKVIPSPTSGILIHVNPIALAIKSARDIVQYNTPPDYLALGVWMGVGLLLSIGGVALIYKYENTYVKVL